MPALEPRDSAAFRRDPAGAYQAGENWVYFSFDPTLFGYALWGQPAAEDVRALCALMELELDRAPHVALVYLRDLTFVSPDAFQVLADYTVKNEAALRSIITHTAIVGPVGVNGAIVAGFFDVTSKPFPVSAWQSLEEAFAHLGRTDGAACKAALTAACEQVSHEASMVRNLRFYLAQHLESPTAEAAADALGMSLRTLQRRLSEHGTSFVLEVQQARLDAAARLLVTTDTPVTKIALDLGFKASQHFATLFRKHTGCTPTEYRERGPKA